MTLVLEAAVKMSVIVALTLLAAVAFRRRSAALRHWTLSVGLTCAATAPLIGLMLPSWQPLLIASRPAQILEAPSDSGMVDTKAVVQADGVGVASAGTVPPAVSSSSPRRSLTPVQTRRGMQV